VAPQSRRRGVASALLASAMARCHQLGAASMFLEVAVDNPGAQQLYEEHGFERVGLRPDYYQRSNGKRASAYTMRGDLARRFAAGTAPEREGERAFG